MIFISKWQTDRKFVHHLDWLRCGGETYVECVYRLHSELWLALDLCEFKDKEQVIGFNFEKLKELARIWFNQVASCWPSEIDIAWAAPECLKEMLKKLTKAFDYVFSSIYYYKPWFKWEDLFEEVLFSYFDEDDL